MWEEKIRPPFLPKKEGEKARRGLPVTSIMHNPNGLPKTKEKNYILIWPIENKELIWTK